MYRAAVPLGLLLLLGACASVPVRTAGQVDLDLPAEFTAAEEAGQWPTPGWWQDFSDDKLQAAIEQALTGNPGLQALTARVAAAEAVARIEGADLYPQAAASLGGSRRKQNFVGLPIPGDDGGVASSTFNDFDLGINVSWEIDLWGRLKGRQRAALEELEASRLDLAAARLSLAGQTARTYFAVVEAEEQLALARNTAANRQRTVDRLLLRYERGLATALDLRLARSSLASAEALVAVRERQRDAGRRLLETLMGRYPAGEVTTAERLPPPPADAPAGLPAELLARRPDLQASERRLMAGDARLASARAELYPRLSLTASGGISSAELGDLLDGDFSVWSLGANLLQPIFQGGRLRAGADLQAASLEADEARFVEQLLAAFLEVEAALTAEHTLARQERALALSTSEAKAAERLSNERYESGLSDYLFVLESQRQALLAESELLAVRRARLEQRIDLVLALGGGFTGPEPRLTAAGGDS